MEETINWNEIAEELMSKFMSTGQGRSVILLDNLRDRDILAGLLKEMFEHFMTDSQSVESPIEDKKGWYSGA